MPMLMLCWVRDEREARETLGLAYEELESVNVAQRQTIERITRERDALLHSGGGGGGSGTPSPPSTPSYPASCNPCSVVGNAAELVELRDSLQNEQSKAQRLQTRVTRLESDLAYSSLSSPCCDSGQGFFLFSLSSNTVAHQRQHTYSKSSLGSRMRRWKRRRQRWRQRRAS